jgi:N-acylneuraminate cytidylyltransferase
MPIKHPYTIGLICARGGSKGVHRKNLRLLAGKPLIGWAIEVARKCPSLDRVVISTEDAEIAEVARKFGAEVPFVRPAEFAEDNSPELAVWQHALRTLATDERGLPEVMVNIPTTSPMRAVEDVENCIAELLKFNADLCLTVRSAQRNPYFNMIKLDDGWASLVITSPTATFRRQDAPEMYDITTVAYAARSEYVLRAQRLLEGKVRAVLVPEERALDIDSELDLAFAEFLKNKEKDESKSVRS